MSRPPRRRWRIEELEPRLLYAADTAALATLGDIGSTFVVSTTADSGPGSLREAITLANGNPGADTIRFDIAAPLVDGAHTITPRSALPALTDTVWLDASREPDALALGRPVVTLVGTDAGGSASALVLADGSDDSLVRGLVVREFGGAALRVEAGADGVTLAGLRIGTDAVGLNAPGNGGNAIETAGARTLVGGPTEADRNLLSGNNAGVRVSGATAAGARIEGNFIGTDATGQSALGNRTVGVYLDAPDASVVGNLISGNGYEGVYLIGSASGATVQGNRIGSDLGGTRALGNGSFGVYVENSRDVLIGGTTPGSGNLIAWQKAGAGISIVGTAGAVSVLGNAVHDNAGLGIDLGAEGVNGYRDADSDGGPNNLLNYPVLASATTQAGATRLVGELRTTADTLLRVEFFVSPQADPQGFGEGRTFLGSVDVRTDASGLARLDTLLAGRVLEAGQSVTATATVQRPTPASGPAPRTPWGDSSEFGNAVAVQVLPSAPVVEAGQRLQVAENSPAGTVVGTLRASDADPGSTLSGWTLQGSTALAVDPATGTVRVVDPAGLDHERQATFTLVASVGDGGLRSAEQTIVVQVGDVDEPPTLQLAPWTIQSGTPLTLGPEVLSVQDPEGRTAALQVEVGRVDGGRFESVDNPGTALDRFSVEALQSGRIRFVATALDQAPVVSLRVSDGSGRSDWLQVRVDWTPAPAPSPAPAPQPPLQPPPLLSVPARGVDDGRGVERMDTEMPLVSGDRQPLAREVQAVAAEQWLAQVQSDSSAEIAALSAQVRDGGPAGAPPARHDAAEPTAVDVLAIAPPPGTLAALQAGLDLPATLARLGELPEPTRDGLDLLREDLADEAGRLQSAIDPIEASGLALTVGLVWWTVRLGGVAGSLLVSVPTWQFFDPLPVLTRPPLAKGGTAPPGAARGDRQDEEAAAAEVLGRDPTEPPGPSAEHDEGLDATGKPGTPGKAGRR